MLLSNAHKKEVLLSIHNSVIEVVAKKKISVDEGFGKAIRMLYGINTYLSISYREKLEYLASLAELTYPVKYDNLRKHEMDAIYGSFVDIHKTPAIN